MNARIRHHFPAMLVLILLSVLAVLAAATTDAAEAKDDWRCTQAADTGRWSCARDGETADAVLESASTSAAAPTAPAEASTPLPLIESEAITPAPVSAKPEVSLDSQTARPIENIAASAVAPVETASSEITSTDASVPIEPVRTETTTTVEQEAGSAQVDAAPVQETPADLKATPDPEPAPAAAPVDPNAPDFQRLAYVPDKPTSLLDLPGDFWVAQIMAVSSKEFLEAYAEEHDLRGLSAARILSGDRLFFVLILGIYETKDRAEQAITNMPPPYNKYKPLLRTLASLQQAMRKADEVTGTANF